MSTGKVVLVTVAVLYVFSLATGSDNDPAPAARPSDDYPSEFDPRADWVDDEPAIERQAIEDSYDEGFAEACSDVYGNGDGALYYRGDEFTEDDCLVQENSSSIGFLSDPSEAYDQGLADGYDAAFFESDVLCYGTTCWSRSDY